MADTTGRMLEQPGSRVQVQLEVLQACHARGPGCSSILPVSAGLTLPGPYANTKWGALNPGPQDRVPESRAPAKYYVTL